MSDKALTNAELELTQKIQMYFPRGVVPSKTITLWNGCPREVLSAKLAEVFGRVPGSVSSKLLLEPIGTITLPATAEQFVACDRFRVSTDPDALVRIDYIDSDFKRCFLHREGKVEDPTGEQTLRYSRLSRFSVDSDIITELGGEDRAETTLSAVFFLMEKQGHGQDGVLLTDGQANIFYVKDIADTLRVVSLRWRVGDWCVCAYSVESSGRWSVGCRVFSRNS